MRLPTLVELFGDRGTITGSPDLHPETGSNLDAGIVIAPTRAVPGTEGEIDRVMIEAAGFATRIHDTISLVPYAGSSAFHAENIADAMTYGGELVMSARLHHLATVTANYTHLETQQISDNTIYDGKALPRQPADAFYGRVDAGYDRFSVYFDASFQAQTFLDQANLAPLPARMLLGTGARIAITSELGISFAVANLADVRVENLALNPPPSPELAHVPTPLADYFGYPLPGRSYYLSLDWSHR
ncbi:MAG: TonB-dependent receptor [Kofleriaceae bacterium]